MGGDRAPAAILKGSFVQNHSWGAANNLYDSAASLLDTALLNNPNFVVTVSAGNRGGGGTATLGSPSTAKNAICVGGNDVANPSNLFIDCLNFDGVPGCQANDFGSSRGPVSGALRTKPDIVANMASSVSIGGENMAFDVPSAMCQTDATKTVYFNYNNSGGFAGTSFAAPEVAGLGALVRDYFQQGFYPTGTATGANALTPSGSLAEAGASHPARTWPRRRSDRCGDQQALQQRRRLRPRNLPGVLHIGSGAPFLWVQNNDSLGQAATKTFFYNIQKRPSRVMMTWYDAAGDALQKNADLKVTIGANVYLGNNFSSGAGADGARRAAALTPPTPPRVCSSIRPTAFRLRAPFRSTSSASTIRAA
jgi:hypothetical protein